jgi:hypothetical protein
MERPAKQRRQSLPMKDHLRQLIPSWCENVLIVVRLNLRKPKRHRCRILAPTQGDDVAQRLYWLAHLSPSVLLAPVGWFHL